MDILKALNIKNKDNQVPVVAIPKDVKTKKISYNEETISVPVEYYKKARKTLLSIFGKDYRNSCILDSVMQHGDNGIAYDITYTVPVTLDLANELTKYQSDEYLYEISLHDFSIFAGYVFEHYKTDDNVSMLLVQISDPRYTQGRNNLSVCLHIEILESVEDK